MRSYYVRLREAPDRAATIRALREVLPLLSVRDCVELLGRLPALVIEGTTEDKAQRMARRLTAAGAVVEVDWERVAGIDYV